jgi:uncharacterized protein (DUF952 family)
VFEQTVAEKLKWESSRGGQLFPHVYGTLETTAVVWVRPLPWTGTAHDFPKGLDA